VIVGSLLLILVAVVLLVLGLTSGSSPLLTGSIAASLLAAVALVVGARQDTAAREAMPDGGGWDDDPVEQSPDYATAGIRARRTGQRGGGYRESYDGSGSGYGGAGYDGSGYGEASYGEAPAASAGSSTATVPTQPSYGFAPPPPAPPERDRYSAPDARPAWEDSGAAAAGAGAVGDQAGGDHAGADRAGGNDAEEFDDEDPPDEPAPQVVSAADAARVARLSTDVLVIDGRPRYHLPGCVHLLGRESEPLPVSEAVELGFTPCSLCEPDNALLTDPHRA
jgi:hypothetical protein